MIDTIEDILNILVVAGMFGFVIYIEISNRSMKKYLKKSEERLINEMIKENEKIKNELAKGDSKTDD